MNKRIEPELTSCYQKNSQDEAFLRRLNSILCPHQEEDYHDVEECYPTLHIVGAPRSGTTLLLQLLAAHTNIGYINNLIAVFWSAPLYGIKLSRKLVPSGMPSTYSSDFGRTRGVNEPHEFGYFWSSLLSYQEMKEGHSVRKEGIDWDRVRMILNNMTHTFNGPIAFKSFLLGWHIESMQQKLPKTCWVRIRRDPTQNALSILDLRKKMLGTHEKWASLKPKEYDWLKSKPYWQQVAGQVYFIEKSHTAQLANVSEDFTLDITYEELCNDPKQVIYKIRSLLGQHNGNIDILSLPPSKFTQDICSLRSHPDGRKVHEAINNFYHHKDNG